MTHSWKKCRTDRQTDSSDFIGPSVERTYEASNEEVQEQKRGFLSMLLGPLGSVLLGNLFSGKGVTHAGEIVIRTEEKILMPPHPFSQ